jgi:predicted ATPase
MRLQSLTIRRFKQLEEFSLSLDDATVLIGANNSGKSSVLQALHFAVSVAQTAKLVGEGVRWAADKFQLSFNPTQMLYSPVADVLSLACGGQLQEATDDQIEIELTTDDGSTCKVAVRRGRNRNIAVLLQGRTLGERLMNLDSPFTIYAPGLAGIAKEERYLSPGVVRRIVARGDANLVLRNVLLMLRDAETAEMTIRVRQVELGLLKDLHDNDWKGPWEQFKENMRELFTGIEFEVKFDKDRDEHIEVFFTRPGRPKLPIDAAGTSVLQASQILAYITLFRPSVLILDEPDSHLHPNNQRALCNLLVSLQSKHHFRTLISTHSRHVLDATRSRASVVWVNNGKQVAYDSVAETAMLMDLGALDSVDYFVGGHLKAVVATEDSASESLEALRALLTSNGFPMGETDVRAYAGCSKIDGARVLCGFLADRAPKLRFVLHRDRDYMSNDESTKFEEQVKDVGAVPFLTEFSDLEGHFINADHLANLNAEIPPDRIVELIDEATKASERSSIEALINIRVEAAYKARKGGGVPNIGEISIKAGEDYKADPARWRRGKIVLKQLKQLMQQELRRNPKIFASSPALRNPVLTEAAAMIWPA